MASILSLLLVQMLLPLSMISCEANPAKNPDDIPYTPSNCQHGAAITKHLECPNDPADDWCYHVVAIQNSVYPYDSFCLLEDPLHGIEPGVVSYEMSVRMHTSYTTAGTGIYFNYRDDKNYEVVYKIDFESDSCAIGHIEEGVVHNSTTFNCGKVPTDDWMSFHIVVKDENADLTLEHGSTSIFSFEPHFPLTAKAGPLIVNAYHNDYLHCQDISLTTETCQDDPDNILCNPCSLAYNEQSLPVTPLPNYRNFLLWYSRSLENVYNVCYIKVLVDKNRKELVKVSSHVGDFSYRAQDSTEEDINVGDVYGERNQCTESNIACVEIKRGGNVTNGLVQEYDRTNIQVTLGNYEGVDHITVNEKLKLIYRNDIVEETNRKFSMMVHNHIYGTEFGIYCISSKESVTKAQETAYNICLAGSYLKDVGEIKEQGWAIKFN